MISEKDEKGGLLKSLILEWDFNSKVDLRDWNEMEHANYEEMCQYVDEKRKDPNYFIWLP